MNDEQNILNEIAADGPNVMPRDHDVRRHNQHEKLEARLNEGVITTKHLDGTFQYNCPVCDQEMKTIGGFGPHSRKHREDAGLLPKRKKRAPKAATPPTPSKPEKITVEEGCLAVIPGITCRKSVPLDRVADVAAWIEYTKEFMKEIK